MVSCPQRNQVFDPIRKKWVEATPEEIVRQKILNHLIGLGYPPHTIVVEKGLPEGAPRRRLDILCLESKTLRPLLLIECKSIPLQEKMLAQIAGYNSFVGAPLICLANEGEFMLQWEKDERVVEHLPTYQELVEWTT